MLSGYNVKHLNPSDEELKKCRVKLIDFGFSKYKVKNTKLDSACGTIDYMSPEVLMG